jgi:hypothetical protein
MKNKQSTIKKFIKRNIDARILPYAGVLLIGVGTAIAGLCIKKCNESQGMSYALNSQDSTQPIAYKSPGSNVYDMRSDTVRAGPWGGYTTYNHPLTSEERKLVNQGSLESEVSK